MQKINSDLANNIGNLCQRTLSMVFKNNAGILAKKPKFDQKADELLKVGQKIAEKLETNINKCDFDTILADFVNMRPVITGSLAARTVEPRQVREEAALRRNPWVPRTTWLSLVSWSQRMTKKRRS